MTTSRGIEVNQNGFWSRVNDKKGDSQEHFIAWSELKVIIHFAKKLKVGAFISLDQTSNRNASLISQMTLNDVEVLKNSSSTKKRLKQWENCIK